MSVSVMPSETVFTVIPRGPSVSASQRPSTWMIRKHSPTS